MNAGHHDQPTTWCRRCLAGLTRWNELREGKPPMTSFILEVSVYTHTWEQNVFLLRLERPVILLLFEVTVRCFIIWVERGWGNMDMLDSM